MADDLVPIASFVTAAQAATARCALEAQGIACFLKDENLVSMNWLYGNAVGYVKLLVPAKQADGARQLLDRPFDDWPKFVQPQQAPGENVATPRFAGSQTAARRRSENPYEAPRADCSPEVVPVQDEMDELGAQARCPSCRRARTAVCPFCRTSGNRFRAADVFEGDAGSDEPALLICPTCDEPFDAVYFRTCEWCGHDFGSGLEVPQILSTSGRPLLNWRVWLVGGCCLGAVAGLLVYFSVLLSR